MEAAAEKSKVKREEFVALQEDDEFDADGAAEYLYMELKSTTSFKDVDIDAMLEHTTFEEFMKGLYSSRVATQKTNQPKNEFEQMWASIMTGE
jgi:hypothetical protein